MTEKAKEWGLTNPKTNKPYSRGKIAEILADEFYIGIATLNRNDKTKKNFRYPHIYPQLISKELFEQCRKVREGKHTNHSNKTKDELLKLKNTQERLRQELVNESDKALKLKTDFVSCRNLHCK